MRSLQNIFQTTGEVYFHRNDLCLLEAKDSHRSITTRVTTKLVVASLKKNFMELNDN